MTVGDDVRPDVVPADAVVASVAMVVVIRGGESSSGPIYSIFMLSIHVVP